jgi:hypothetical protein
MISSLRDIWNVRSNVDGRMLKTVPNFVLGARPSSTYRWERAGLGRLGAARVEWRYASGALFACGLVG